MAEYTKCLVINDFLLATVHEDALIFPLMRTPSAALSLWDLLWAAVRGCFLFFQGGRSPAGTSVHLCSPTALCRVEEGALVDSYKHSLLQGLEILWFSIQFFFFFLRILKIPSFATKWCG